MVIYIQKIQTNWTKLSRGNPAASLRNSVPEKLPIETIEFSDSVVFQEIIYDEGRFTQPNIKRAKIINEQQIREQRLEFELLNNQLNIYFWNENKVRKKGGVLHWNNWCQLKTNRRVPLEFTWRYYKIVYNVFYGDSGHVARTIKENKAEFERDYQTLLI